MGLYSSKGWVFEIQTNLTSTTGEIMVPITADVTLQMFKTQDVCPFIFIFNILHSLYNMYCT